MKTKTKNENRSVLSLTVQGSTLDVMAFLTATTQRPEVFHARLEQPFRLLVVATVVLVTIVLTLADFARLPSSAPARKRGRPLPLRASEGSLQAFSVIPLVSSSSSSPSSPSSPDTVADDVTAAVLSTSEEFVNGKPKDLHVEDA